jgi:hypothetical protein
MPYMKKDLDSLKQWLISPINNKKESLMSTKGFNMRGNLRIYVYKKKFRFFFRFLFLSFFQFFSSILLGSMSKNKNSKSKFSFRNIFKSLKTFTMEDEIVPHIVKIRRRMKGIYVLYILIYVCIYI